MQGAKIFQMEIVYLFLWTVLHAREEKLSLENVIIVQAATALISKT